MNNIVFSNQMLDIYSLKKYSYKVWLYEKDYKNKVLKKGRASFFGGLRLMIVEQSLVDRRADLIPIV